MKQKSFFVITVLLFYNISFSQTPTEKFNLENPNLTFTDADKKLSTAFFAGSVKNSNNKSSGSYGAEFTYSISKRFSLVGNYLSRNSGGTDDDDNNRAFSEKDYAGGIRFYTGESKIRFFLEGLIDLNIHKESLAFDNTVGQSSLGLMLGAGTEFKLFDNFSGILKANVTKFDKPGSANGIFGGIKYRF